MRRTGAVADHGAELAETVKAAVGLLDVVSVGDQKAGVGDFDVDVEVVVGDIHEVFLCGFVVEFEG